MGSVVSRSVIRHSKEQAESFEDLIVVEEPLEIRLGYGPKEDRKQLALAVTMRTPGEDEDLTLGFLHSEQVIHAVTDVLSVKHCDDLGMHEQKENVIRAELAPEVRLDPEVFRRNFYTTSSCGVCGKASIEQVRLSCQPLSDNIRIDVDILGQAIPRLQEAQLVFRHTGSLHAAALFALSGDLLCYREDVGRHNALDKLLGHLLLTRGTMHQSLLLLSGRISFELVQKAAVARIPIIAALGAPSSLAVKLAEELGITLVGFLKADGCNIYTHFRRIKV